MTRPLRAAGALATVLLAARVAPAQPAPPPAVDSPAPAKRDEARTHFELGLLHFDRSEWSAALAEFLEANDLYPTRAATKNAAICMRHVNRFDDALDLFERLVRDYPDLSPADRALADAEILELSRSVGTLLIHGAEPGATVVVDGKERGLTPLPSPLRLSVGTHVVRVAKREFLPFERRVEIASGGGTELDAKLAPLVRSGRLRVMEQAGRSLEVVLDGAVVGKTPWAGVVAPGTHDVLLRGDGTLGAQPVVAPVMVDEETSLSLVAEDLDASARIEPTPGGALVAVDGVPVGRGVWEGRLRSGRHRIEITAEGFLPSTREAFIGPHARQLVRVILDRDPLSPLWGRRSRGHFSVEVEGARSLAPTFGGQVGASCGTSCAWTVPRGGLALLRAGYDFPQGLGVGVEAGYLGIRQRIDDRAARISGSALLAPDAGTVNDILTMNGLLFGGSVLYRRGEIWTFSLRLGVGAYLAAVTDVRNGSFRTSSHATPSNAPYAVGVAESHGVSFLYVAPAVRVGRRVGDHLELNAGLELFLLATPTPPSWEDQVSVLAAPPDSAGDGLGTFGAQTLTGNVIVVVAPGVGARYEF